MCVWCFCFVLFFSRPRACAVPLAPRYGRERAFTCVLVCLAVVNFALPALIETVVGGFAYAVVVGTCSGVLVALVLPLATAALSPEREGLTAAAAGIAALANVRDSASAASASAAAAAAAERVEKERAAADWPPSASITSGLVYSTIALGVRLAQRTITLSTSALGSTHHAPALTLHKSTEAMVRWLGLG